MDASSLFDSVVVVEDDQSHALLIKRVVSKLCGQVVVAHTVSEGIAAVSETSPNLVITDLHLPDSDGLKHVEALLEASKGSPVIVLTSSTSIQDAVRAMRLGAADYVVKSFDDNFDEMIGLTLARVRAAEELRQEKRKLEQEMAALRIAIDNGQDGMAVVSSNEKILYKNSAFDLFAERFGGDAASLSSLFGSKVKNLDKLVKEFLQNMTTLEPGAVWTTEVAISEERDAGYALSLSAIETLSDGSTRCVVWIRNISELKRRERFQKEILSTTTHDLKGPLAAISLCAEMLTDMVKTPDKAHDLVVRIVSSSKGALGLIDEFLSARRIQEGTFILQPSPQDVTTFINSVVEEYQPIAAARKINLSFSSAPGSQTAKLDPLGVTRVLGNIISNALKFTESGGAVTVKAEVNEGALTISITDTGSGMEPAEAQIVFERFSRLSKHQGIQGTGLGLYVAKNIVTAHGGSIRVTSQPGRGSTFTIEFPTDPPINEKGQILCFDFA